MKKLIVLIVFANVLYCTKCKVVRDNIVVNVETFDARMEGLVNLLRYIIEKYFEDCACVIIYDANFERKQSLFLQHFFRNASTAFIHERIGISSFGKLKFGLNDKCYDYILFLENLSTIKRAIERETVNKVVVVSTTTSWTVNDFLRSHLSKFYTNLLIITHSASRKAREGSYLLYTHKLYNDGIGSNKPVLLTSWIKDSLTKKNTTLFPEKLRDGFNGHRLLISTAHKPPFAIRKTISGTDDTRWDGIDIRVIRLLGQTLNFTADFRNPSSSTSSPIVAAVKDIALGSAAAAIGGIYQTTNLTTRFDLSFSHVDDCASFISLASTALPKYRAVLGPFQISVWLLLSVAYLIAIIPFTINSEYSLLSLLSHPSKFNNMFWFVFSTFTNCFIVKNPMLKYGLGKNSTSVLIGIYWVFTIIITSCYTSSIIAFIMVPVYPGAMETVQQLVRYRYQIGTLDHDGWQTWFNYLDDPLAEKLLKNIEYVPSVEEGVRNASRAYFWPYAFLGSQTLLEYIVQANFTPNWATKRSLMHISNECFMRFGVTFVMPRKSVYTDTFNKVIYRAHQSGILQKIVRDVRWDIQRSGTGKLLQVNKSPSLIVTSLEERRLSLDDIQGMFLVLGAGSLIAIFILILECTVHCISKHCFRRHNDDSGDDNYELQWKSDEYEIGSWNQLDESLNNKLKRRNVRGSI